MSGIPVYTQSPISAAKATGTTPQTAAPPTYGTPLAPSAAKATTTATPASTTSYAPARPGQAPAAAPTSAASRYLPAQVQPTPTKTTQDDGPPAPQPGAVPTPMNGYASTAKSSLPPPPKAGESFHPPQTSVPQPFPPQMSLPPPTTAYSGQPPSSSTSTATAPSGSYPISLPVENYGDTRRSFEHPPGYVQNPYASNFSADQRRAQDAQNTTHINPFGSDNTGSNTASFGVDTEGVWNTAKKWAQTAGEKLSQTEADIWKKVNGEK